MPADPVASVETDGPDLTTPFPEPSVGTGLPDRPTHASLRNRLEGWAESLDLSLPRLIAGVAVVAVLGVAGWRLLDAPAAPPEMALPMTSSTGPAAASALPGSNTTAPDDHADARSPASSDRDGSAGKGEALRNEMVVHVAGAVRQPGVQHLEPAARVVDAVESAGGAAEDADLARVNLAAPLEDGQQVYIPRVGEDLPTPVTSLGGPTAADSDGSSGAEPSGGVVNINTAGTSELETLHGIGPALAQAIVDHRDEHGLFASVDQLTDVRGIGQAKLDGLRDQVTV